MIPFTGAQRVQIAQLVNLVADFEFAIRGKARSGCNDGRDVEILGNKLKAAQKRLKIVLWLDSNIDREIANYNNLAKVAVRFKKVI